MRADAAALREELAKSVQLAALPAASDDALHQVMQLVRELRDVRRVDPTARAALRHLLSVAMAELARRHGVVDTEASVSVAPAPEPESIGAADTEKRADDARADLRRLLAEVAP